MIEKKGYPSPHTVTKDQQPQKQHRQGVAVETFITLQPKDTKTPIIINTAHIIVAYVSPGGTTLMLTNGGTIQTRYPISALERHLNQVATVYSLTQEHAPKTGAKNKERSR